MPILSDLLKKKATEVTYDNTSSGLAATQVQSALDEVSSLIVYDIVASDDLTTINSKINSASDGDLLTFEPATYSIGGSIEVTKNISLKGNGAIIKSTADGIIQINMSGRDGVAITEFIFESNQGASAFDGARIANDTAVKITTSKRIVRRRRYSSCLTRWYAGRISNI